MEKFLLILRDIGLGRNENGHDDGLAVNPGLAAWILALSKSGNYDSGVPVGLGSQYVTGNNMSKSRSLGDADDRILRFDVIMAENINQAVSIAGGCPLVEQGLAVIELRTILQLVR